MTFLLWFKKRRKVHARLRNAENALLEAAPYIAAAMEVAEHGCAIDSEVVRCTLNLPPRVARR